MLTLACNNDNLIVLQNVTDFISGPVVDMTGWVTIYDQTNGQILSGCNEIALVLATTWNGVQVYYVLIPYTVQIIDGTNYRALIQGTGSYPGFQREISLVGQRMLSS